MISQQIRLCLKTFLFEHTVYDILATNNQVVVIDTHFKCLQFIELFFVNNCENVMVWDESKSEFEAILSYREIVKIVLRSYYNVINQKSNLDFYRIQEDDERELSATSLMDSNSMEVENDEKYKIDDKTENMNNLQKTYKTLSQEQKNQLLSDLQVVTINQFMFSSNVPAVLLADEKSMILECCQLMKQNDRSYINILDSQSNLIVATLSHKDIILYMIQNLQLKENDKLIEFFNEPFDIYQLKILKQENQIIQCKMYESVYQLFKTMNHHKLRTISIVDDNMSYIGMIHLSDIKFILKQTHFEILSRDCLYFLDYLKQQKQQYNATKNQQDPIYQKNCSIADLVKQLLETHENKLVKLDVDNLVEAVIGFEDLFEFIIENIE